MFGSVLGGNMFEWATITVFLCGKGFFLLPYSYLLLCSSFLLPYFCQALSLLQFIPTTNMLNLFFHRQHASDRFKLAKAIQHMDSEGYRSLSRVVWGNLQKQVNFYLYKNLNYQGGLVSLGYLITLLTFFHCESAICVFILENQHCSKSMSHNCEQCIPKCSKAISVTNSRKNWIKLDF